LLDFRLFLNGFNKQILMVRIDKERVDGKGHGPQYDMAFSAVHGQLSGTVQYQEPAIQDCNFNRVRFRGDACDGA